MPCIHWTWFVSSIFNFSCFTKGCCVFWFTNWLISCHPLRQHQTYWLAVTAGEKYSRWGSHIEPKRFHNLYTKKWVRGACACVCIISFILEFSVCLVLPFSAHLLVDFNLWLIWSNFFYPWGFPLNQILDKRMYQVVNSVSVHHCQYYQT